MRLTLAIALMGALSAAGCGTSQIITDDPTAHIWANGQLIGRGHAEIQQRGTPETTSIVVRTDDGRQQITSVKRRITGVTVIGALLTYGTCLIFCWEYPDTVYAAVPPRIEATAGVTAFQSDPWLTPPPGWQGPPEKSTAPPRVAVPPGEIVQVPPPAPAPRTLVPPAPQPPASPGSPGSAQPPPYW